MYMYAFQHLKDIVTFIHVIVLEEPLLSNHPFGCSLKMLAIVMPILPFCTPGPNNDNILVYFIEVKVNILKHVTIIHAINNARDLR